MSDSLLVSPGSVRVWRGFRLPTLSVSDFQTKLGTVFVPATVKMQIVAGLRAYLPTAPAGLPDKPDSVPDETAILFWPSPATYWNGFTRLAVRTYTLTHNGVYITENGKSRADFPVIFEGNLQSEQSVYLFENPADWMRGNVRHLLAARPASLTPEAFHAAVAQVLARIQQTVALEGAIACAGDDYFMYWELGPLSPGAQQAPSGVPLLEELLKTAAAGWSQAFNPAPTYLPIELWDEWAGMDVKAGSSFNMQFERAPQS